MKDKKSAVSKNYSNCNYTIISIQGKKNKLTIGILLHVEILLPWGFFPMIGHLSKPRKRKKETLKYSIVQKC